jgi:biopolymer transport protein ExbD
MAFSMNGGQRGGRRSFRGGTGTLSEINIVPLVDVVLVLLIIFMITAHVMEYGMEVDVPQTKVVESTPQVLPVINITRDGKLFLIDKPIQLYQLNDAVLQMSKEKSAYVRADKEVTWDMLAQVVSQLHQGGINVRLVTQPLDTTGTRRK